MQLFALVVAIEEYPQEEWKDYPVDGAFLDLEQVVHYLRADLHVPAEHIVTLRGPEATRRNIITQFQSHLIQNSKINAGDALLFHFSGHGSRQRAPSNWPILVERTVADEEEIPMIETTIPYDEGLVGPDGLLVCGIPDRTLGALLDLAAIAHGDNITVVLDCCHSGHGIRGASGLHPFKPRSIGSQLTTPLREELDREIWGSDRLTGPAADSQKNFLRAAFTEHRAKSHILMAACGQKEQALGSNEGGLLTIHWLKALRNPRIHPRSYAEMMKNIIHDIDNMRIMWPGIIDQHPQCEGVARDRLVFETVRMKSDLLPIRMGDSTRSQCLVECPCEVLGIMPGTELELYDMDKLLQVNRILGSAIVTTIAADHCYAQLPRGIYLSPSGIYAARVSQYPYRLTFHVRTAIPDSPSCLEVHEFLEQSLRRASSEQETALRRLNTEEHAELILQIDEDSEGTGGVTFVRRDLYLRDLPAKSPRLDWNEARIANFPHILNAIARFNFYLSRRSESHPYSDQVQMDFYELQDDPTYDPDDDGPSFQSRKLSKKITFANDEARIIEDETIEYAFVLRSTAPASLFPYIIYFDPGTYEICMWYAPAEDVRPTLVPNQSLQIGASPEHRDPFEFFVRAGETIDTSFLKVFIMENPTRLEFMEQGPELGRDEYGRSHVEGHRRVRDETGIKASQHTGGWDCFTRRITVKAS